MIGAHAFTFLFNEIGVNEIEEAVSVLVQFFCYDELKVIIK